MNFRTMSSRLSAVVCSIVLVPATVPAARAEPVSQEASAPAQEAPKIPNDQLDALVAPIALYPDPLLAQVLAASTYPLEIMQLQQWLAKNKDLKDKALADAVAKQPWDSSVQAMAPLPDLVKRLADDIQWATDLGNAFLAQQSDVMDAVQRMRAKAKDTGNLKSNEQMKVETKVIENKSVVVIQQSSPEVVYVPSYNPTVVYGPPVYPYPPISYPPPGYYAAGMAISFGVGMAMGAAWGGGWGNCGWGGNNDITINNNNNYNRSTNVSGGNRNTSVGSGNRGGNTSGGWQHNPQHRGGAPYANKSTASKYGGTARGDSMGNRQADARQRQQQGAGNRASGGAGDRGGNRASDGAGDRGGDRAGASDRGGNRQSAGTRDSNRGGGGDRVGDRSVSQGSKGGGAFGGSSGGGSGARASSSRGSSSMGGSRGGGGGGRRR
jgi:Protein of unknown function (DUF3300)